MKRKRFIWFAFIIILVVGAGFGFYGLARQRSVTAPIQEDATQTAVARIGDLSILASGSGEVIPAAEIGLNFDGTGTVLEILVNIGDSVKAGDVMVRLQIDKTEAQLAAEVTIAKLALIQAQQNLDNAYETAEIKAAEALVELEDAQLALESVTNLELEKALALQEVSLAEETIANAEMLLYIYNSSPSAEDVYTAYASLLFKQVDLEDLQDRVKTTIFKIKSAPNDNLRSRYEDQLLQLNPQLANQKVVVEESTYKLNSLNDATNPLDVAVAEAQMTTAQARLVTAQRELEQLQAGPKSGDVAAAEARLSAAQVEWETLKEGQDPDEIARLETQVEVAQLELALAQDETTVVDLVAPIDATVMSININVGDRVSAGNQTGTTGAQSSSSESGGDIFDIFFSGSNATTESDDSLIRIADLSQGLLEVNLDETDLERVKIGYQVEVVFDALPDETFIGHIVEISPALVEVSGTQAIQVLVKLDEASYAKPIPLPSGLNASIDVIAGRAVGAVLVPVEALVTEGPDDYVVYVVENGIPQRRDVSVGLMDYTFAEITAGLEAGEILALESTGTQ